LVVGAGGDLAGHNAHRGAPPPGTALGLITLIQALGMAASNLAAGRLADMAGAGSQNPAGYEVMLLFFFVLSLTACSQRCSYGDAKRDLTDIISNRRVPEPERRAALSSAPRKSALDFPDETAPEDHHAHHKDGADDHRDPGPDDIGEILLQGNHHIGAITGPRKVPLPPSKVIRMTSPEVV